MKKKFQRKFNNLFLICSQLNGKDTWLILCIWYELKPMCPKEIVSDEKFWWIENWILIDIKKMYEMLEIGLVK